MTLNEMYSFLTTITPIEQVHPTWQAMGYTADWFNEAAAAPDFSGWGEGDRPAEEEVQVITNLLKAQPGERLLDVACGYGRHALLLAEKYRLNVTGIDVSLGLIHAAKRLADERGVDIVYEVKDATDVAWREAFHHAIVAYNSFSLFSPGAAPVVLKGLYRSLKPSGRLFMDLDNQRFERRRYQYANPLRGWYTWPGGLTLQEVYFHNDSSVEVSRDVIFKTTATRAETFMTFKKLYSQDEIENLLSSCSFHVEEIYGDWDLSPLRTNSSKMLLIAVRK